MRKTDAPEYAGLDRLVKVQVKALGKTFAKNIRYLRIKKAMTQTELGTLCGMTRIQVCQIELGNYCPSLATMVRMSISLKMEIEELLSDATWKKLHADGVRPDERVV